MVETRLRARCLRGRALRRTEITIRTINAPTGRNRWPDARGIAVVNEPGGCRHSWRGNASGWCDRHAAQHVDSCNTSGRGCRRTGRDLPRGSEPSQFARRQAHITPNSSVAGRDSADSIVAAAASVNDHRSAIAGIVADAAPQWPL